MWTTPAMSFLSTKGERARLVGARCSRRVLRLPTWLAAGLLATGLLAAGLTGAAAWRPAAAQAREVFEHYSEETGLAAVPVTSIVQDRQGYLWVGTYDGLRRYDGYGSTVYRHDPTQPNSLSDNYVKVHALLEDRRGRLWIGTLRGLNRRDPVTGHITRYVHDPDDDCSLSHDNIVSLYETRSGVLWVGTQQGLNRYDPETGCFTRYHHDPADPHSLSNDYVAALVEDERGALWVGTAGGLNRLGGGRFTHYVHDAGDPSSLSHDYVYSLTFDRRGQLWAGTWGGGLCRYDPETGRFEHLGEEQGAPEALRRAVVVSVLEDKRGQLWIGTWGNGLYRYEPGAGRFTRYVHDLDDAQSLPSNQVTSLFADRTGVLWVGTWDGLVKVVPAPAFAVIGYDHRAAHRLSHPQVSAVHESRDGLVWIGTRGGGLNRYDPVSGRITHYRSRPEDATSLSHDDISSIWEDQSGALWIGTNGGGLNRMNRETGTFVRYRHDPRDPTSLASDLLYTVREDRAGRLWVGTVGHGLDRYDRETGTFVHHRHDPGNPASLSYDAVWSVHEDRAGRLWVGTLGGGLNRFDVEAGRFEHHLAAPADAHRLQSNKVDWIGDGEDGTLWIGTLGGGASRFDPAANVFTTYTERDGLPAPNVGCILPGTRGEVWMATTAGLARLDPEAGRFVIYGKHEGLPGAAMQSGACHRSPRGTLYFGTRQGLVVFHPDSLVRNPTPPPIVLTGISVFDEPLALDTAASYLGQLVLPYDRNFIALTFATLDYTNPSQNQYVYQLEGLDRQWVEAGGTNRAAYTGLSPGRYTFRVRGSNNDGVWSEREAVLSLVITPPYWQAWWFRLLLVAGLAGLLYEAHRYRVRQLLRVEQTRRRIADDLHDDLGSKVGTIAIQLDRLGRQARPGTVEQRQLHDILATTRQLASDLRDTVWVVHAENDRLSDLIERMHGVARLLLANHVYTFEAPRDVPGVVLGMELRRHTLLLFKEALHNAVRHAEAMHIDVEVAWNEGLLSLTIVDDGRGFDPGSVQAGRGLRAMNRRADEIGGQLAIESQPGRGTVVRLCVRNRSEDGNGQQKRK